MTIASVLAIGGASGMRYRLQNAVYIAARQRMRWRQRGVGYHLNQSCRKKAEEMFGWCKTIGTLVHTRLIR